jgi:peptide chain release factor 1
MLDRLRDLEREHQDLEARLGDPALIADQSRYQDVARRYSELGPIVEAAQQLQARTGDLEAAKEMLSGLDGDEREEMRAEVTGAEADIERLEAELKVLLLPKDPNDGKNVIVEIRGAEGGEEANLFARDLFGMYQGYAGRMGWKAEVMGSDASDMGGFNEVTFLLKGDGVWPRMKHEGGPHRVQRVPVTESQGRIHTSSATVTVLPEAEEVEVDIDPNDLQIDVYRSSGPGGQSVNTTDSAVRMTHIPTGIVVSCQNEKSQIQNRAAALRVLEARLLERRRQEERAAMDALKTDTSGSWGNQMRSYVLHPYQMVKDLRTEYETGNTSGVLDGDIDEFIEAGIRWRRQGGA